jgi:hypothetical protein
VAAESQPLAAAKFSLAAAAAAGWEKPAAAASCHLQGVRRCGPSFHCSETAVGLAAVFAGYQND